MCEREEESSSQQKVHNIQMTVHGKKKKGREKMCVSVNRRGAIEAIYFPNDDSTINESEVTQ